MKKIIKIGLSSFLLVALLFGQTATRTGTVTAQFLKIGVGGRATAMGDAFTAISDDATAIYWNAAGLSSLKSTQLFTSHINWLGGINYNYLSFGSPIGNLGVVGVYATSVNVPTDEVRTVSQPEGTGEYFDAGNFSVGLAYSRKVTDRFSFGIVGKYLNERIWTMSASSMAVDIGTIYTSTWRNLRIGIILKNYGTKMKFSGRATLVTTDPDPVIEGNNEYIRAELLTNEWDIPLNLVTSLALDVINAGPLKAVVAFDMVHPNDNAEYFNVGLEATAFSILKLRTGYRQLGTTNQEGGLTFGGGVDVPLGGKNIGVDFSIIDFGRLKDVKQISLRMGI